MKDRMLATGRALKRVLRDPLAQFLLLGALLFAAYGALGAGGDETRITVSKDKLLTFIQYRSKIFDTPMAEARLAAMSPEELRQVVDDYVTEEALYREAKALGLDSQDYIIKRRMVQKVEFIASGFEDQKPEIDEKRLRAYFEDNRDRFSAPPSYTFTHVFISSDQRSPKTLAAAAGRLKQELAASKAGFTDAPRFGERFAYGVNFVETTPEQIEGQFGDGFARQLAALKPADGVWQGPLTSEFGAHIVMLVAKGEPAAVKFEDVRSEVEAEYSRVVAEELQKQAVAKIVARYPVDMRFDDPRIESQ